MSKNEDFEDMDSDNDEGQQTANIKGNILVGEDQKNLNQYDVGWLDLFTQDELSDLTLTAGEKGARVLLYAAKPLGEEIVSYGPFIADSQENIADLYRKYRQGKLPHINTFTGENLIKYE